MRARAYEWCVRSMLSRVARYGADWILTHAAVALAPCPTCACRSRPSCTPASSAACWLRAARQEFALRLNKVSVNMRCKKVLVREEGGSSCTQVITCCQDSSDIAA